MIQRRNCVVSSELIHSGIERDSLCITPPVCWSFGFDLFEQDGYALRKAVKAVNEMVESRHQFLLEAAENLNPALGAALDTRPPIPELPDDAL